jgi:RNA polymerase sigma-70 factor (ECF subfamily)
MSGSPPPAPRPDDLARAVLDGEPQALERWYRAEHPSVWRLCLGFLGRRAEADDVAQDAMLHLHDRLLRWDQARPFEAWRNGVVLNFCRDRRRRAAARQRAEGRAALERDMPVILPEPGATLEQGELAALVTQSLSVLTEREREAFVLHDLEGRPSDEVARAMDIAQGSVRALLTLARRRLRELLAPRLAGYVPGSERG